MFLNNVGESVWESAACAVICTAKIELKILYEGLKQSRRRYASETNVKYMH